MNPGVLLASSSIAAPIFPEFPDPDLPLSDQVAPILGIVGFALGFIGPLLSAELFAQTLAPDWVGTIHAVGLVVAVVGLVLSIIGLAESEGPVAAISLIGIVLSGVSIGLTMGWRVTESATVLRNRRRRMYTLVPVWVAGVLLFVFYLWLSGPRTLPSLLLLGLLCAAAIAGAWKVSRFLKVVPSSITIDKTSLSFVQSSLLGKKVSESLELARVRNLKAEVKGSRAGSLVIQMADGRRRVLREIDALTAREAERMFGESRPSEPSRNR